MLFSSPAFISDLKAKLSAHIRPVRDGEEVLVCDRNKPVARSSPVVLKAKSQRNWRGLYFLNYLLFSFDRDNSR